MARIVGRVGDEHGRIRDLSDPSDPPIWEVEEDSTDNLY